MHAVHRETFYASEVEIQKTEALKAFQRIHEAQPGYVGTIVTTVGEGRYLTITLWETKKDMDKSRETLEKIVEDLLNPIMRFPAILNGTGPVIINDFIK